MTTMEAVIRSAQTLLAVTVVPADLGSLLLEDFAMVATL